MKDAHLQNFLSFLKKTLDFPGGGRYNKTRSPARTPREYAPVAQMDRALDSDSKGRWFESSRAYQNVLMKDAAQKTPHESAVFSHITHHF